MSRRKFTDEELTEAVQEYLNGKGSYYSIAQKYKIDYEQFRRLVIRAQTEGIESVKKRHTLKKYSSETKLAAIHDYLDGKGTQLEICQKYHITTPCILIQWIKCYNIGMKFGELMCSERGNTMYKGK